MFVDHGPFSEFSICVKMHQSNLFVADQLLLEEFCRKDLLWIKILLVVKIVWLDFLLCCISFDELYHRPQTLALIVRLYEMPVTLNYD